MGSITISIPSGANLRTTCTKSDLVVVNRVVDADFAKIFLFRGPGGAENFDAASPRKLHRGNSHTAGRAVDEDSIAGKQIAHREHRVVGREIVDGDGGGILEGHAGGRRYTWRAGIDTHSA